MNEKKACGAVLRSHPMGFLFDEKYISPRSRRRCFKVENFNRHFSGNTLK